MRLAVVSPFVDRRHGTERALAELLERLAGRHGCEVHLYAQRVEDLALTFARDLSPDRGAIVWHRVPSTAGPHLLQFLAWLLLNGLLRTWHTFVRRAHYDVLLSPGINCLHPDVVVVHALFHRLSELSGAGSAARLGLLRRIHRSVYYGLVTALERRTYADTRVTLAAVSKRTAGLLQKYFRRTDVCVVPNGVDATRFSPAARLAKRATIRQCRGFRDNEFVVLLIGNDWNTKGLPTLLKGIAFIKDLPVRLLVIGTDSPEPFQSLASELGVSDRCCWETPRTDVLDFYAAADAYVSPTREDSFGLPVAEAMACGLPVITSAFAGVADFVRQPEDGFVMNDPDDAQSLATIIRELYGRRQSGLPKHSENAAHFWTWDQNADAVFSLLQLRVPPRRA